MGLSGESISRNCGSVLVRKASSALDRNSSSGPPHFCSSQFGSDIEEVVDVWLVETLALDPNVTMILQLPKVVPQLPLAYSDVASHLHLASKRRAFLPGIHQQHGIREPGANAQPRVSQNEIRQCRKSGSHHLVLDHDLLKPSLERGLDVFHTLAGKFPYFPTSLFRLP